VLLPVLYDWKLAEPEITKPLKGIFGLLNIYYDIFYFNLQTSLTTLVLDTAAPYN